VALGDLVLEWRARAAEFRDLAAEGQARAFDRCAADLGAALSADGDEVLNLTSAATESGYSADPLGRLIRRGELENVGRANAPRIRRRDLPRKPGALSPAPRLGILPLTKTQIARSVVHSNR
jgi:hypothetical protein